MRSCTAVVAALLGSIGPGCSGSGAGSKESPAPPADVKRIDALAKDMKAAARAADAKRTQALLAATTQLAPRADRGRCPIAVPVVGTDDVTRLSQGEPKDAPADWRSIRANQMMVVKAEELATAKSARLKNVEQMIEYERRQLNEINVADVDKWLRYYGDVNNASWELVVVASRLDKPEILDGGKFRGGAIAGRAFVYDHPTGTVVCAADVAAESSQVLSQGRDEPSVVAEQRLRMDLENEAFREAAKALVMAGPIGATGDASPAATSGAPGHTK